MKLTYIRYRAVCPSEQLLFRRLRENGINAEGIVTRGGEVFFSAAFTQKKLIVKTLRGLNCEWSECGQGMIVRLARRLGRRWGLIAGAVVCGIVLISSQYYVINIEVLTDDPEISERVNEVLGECGISAGTYIPSIERVKAERTLRQKVEEISWAGITLADSTVIVDVLENIPEPKRADDHCPSNLTAKYDAVIDKLDILNGTAVKTSGSGVVAGEILVSGIVPVEHITRDKEGRPVTEMTEKYVRSIGNVYGSFSITESFTQPLSDTKLVYLPKEVRRYSLRLFSAEIPLTGRQPKGMLSRTEKLRLISDELPVGIRSYTFTPYSFSTVIYNRKQAEQAARDMEKRYVRNFLDSYEVRGRRERITETADGVTLTVTYDLYGVISEEKPFYIFPKNTAPDTPEPKERSTEYEEN
ncbi:MAG: sporulation protein YqfD [Ruminococcus sp.]|nr:sporulation protein YqfD [Ruminococcus sp.]